MDHNTKQKINYLIYDSCAENIISKIIDIKKTKILNFRKKENKILKVFNLIPIFIKIIIDINLLKILFSEGIFIAFVCERIKTFKPKFVITSTDNDIRFYKLKKFNPNIKFVAIQNGLRSKFHDIFDRIDINDKKNLSADFYCAYGNNLKYQIQKYINTDVISIGSYINNTVKKQNLLKIKNNILYTSSFRNINHDKLFDKYLDGKKIFWKDLIKYEIKLVKKLNEYCIYNNLTLTIAGSSIENHMEELKYYKKILPYSKWVFIRKRNFLDNYYLLDKYDLVCSCFSTIGIEALSRDCKVAFFGRDFSKHNDWLYGWPKNLGKKGFFYSNLISDKEVKRILNNLINVDRSTWKKIVIKESKSVMEFDYNNSKLKKILKIY